MHFETQASPIRVLVVDDHPMIRDGISAMLEREDDLECVGEASNGVDAIERFRELSPDVVLMDVQMGKIDGVAATAAIRALAPEARIMVLTTYAGDALAVRALRAGASGYLLKDCLRTELAQAIRQVHAGKPVISADIARELAVHSLDTPLSGREIEILQLVREGLANKEIGLQLRLSADTVKAYLKTVFEKLSVSDRTQAVSVATRRGYL